MTDDRANPADATGPAIRESVGFDALYRKNAINETAGGARTAAWQFFGGPIATVALGNDIVTSFLNDAQTRSAIQFGQTTPPWGSISTDQLGYDGAGRLIGKRHILSGATIVGFTTQYDPSSNKLFERALHAESRSALYANDSMDRLIEYQRGVLATGGGSITTPIALPGTDIIRNYTLDGLGNWPNTWFTPVGGSPSLDVRTHNKLNQITAFDAPSAPTPVLYDQGNNTGSPPQKGNGNIINDGTRANVFDALNRLRTVNKASGGALGAYVYDALGRRIIRQVPKIDKNGFKGMFRFQSYVSKDQWGVFTRIEYHSDLGQTCCNRIAMIQLVAFMYDDGTQAPIPNNTSRGMNRRTPELFYVDQTDENKVVYYQIQNGMKDKGEAFGTCGRGCSSSTPVIPKEAAVIMDHPGFTGKSLPNVSFRAKTFAVCIGGNDTGKVYDAIDWGFDTDKNGRITGQLPAPAVAEKDPAPKLPNSPNPRSDFDILQDALDAWNDQGGGNQYTKFSR